MTKYISLIQIIVRVNKNFKQGFIVGLHNYAYFERLIENLCKEI